MNSVFEFLLIKWQATGFTFGALGYLITLSELILSIFICIAFVAIIFFWKIVFKGVRQPELGTPQLDGSKSHQLPENRLSDPSVVGLSADSTRSPSVVEKPATLLESYIAPLFSVSPRFSYPASISVFSIWGCTIYTLSQLAVAVGSMSSLWGMSYVPFWASNEATSTRSAPMQSTALEGVSDASNTTIFSHDNMGSFSVEYISERIQGGDVTYLLLLFQLIVTIYLLMIFIYFRGGSQVRESISKNQLIGGVSSQIGSEDSQMGLSTSPKGREEKVSSWSPKGAKWWKDPSINFVPSEQEFIIMLSFLALLAVMYSSNLIYTYIALELFGISSYILTGSSYNKKGIEGALKYFLLGTLGTIFICISFVLMYSMYGSLNLEVLKSQLYLSHMTSLSDTSFGHAFPFALFILGVFLKIGLPPVHFWILDVYASIPFLIFTYLLIIPKYVFFVFLYKLLVWELPFTVWASLSNFLWMLAIANIAFGSLTALSQRNLKRLFTSSSIANFGYILLPLAAYSSSSLLGSIMYLTFYTIFMIPFLYIFYKNQNALKFFTSSSLNSVTNLSLFDRILLVMFLAIFTGLPPFLMFYSKVLLLLSLMESQAYLLGFILFIFSAISAAYYLNLIKILIFDNALFKSRPTDFQYKESYKDILSLIIIISFGILPTIPYTFYTLLSLFLT